MGKERRKHFRVPIAAEVAEPVEIALVGAAVPSNDRPAKAQKIPAILANISAGGMALVAFAQQDTFSKISLIQMVVNLPGLGNSTISGKLVHLKAKEGIQTLGVRFDGITKKLRDRIRHLIDDYADCETRVALRIPEVCVGRTCHYFGLCNKIQKLEIT